MGDVSENFDRGEFACRCGCGFEAVDIKLLELAQNIRYHYKKPLMIHCACRCLKHNRDIGSKDTSQHVRGIALDFHIVGEKSTDIYKWIEENLMDGWGGLGLYDTFVHIDVRRGDKRRWAK